MIRKHVVIIVLLLPLSACSTFGFLFERLPWLTKWQFDTMYELNDEQALIVEDGAKAMQRWFIARGFPDLITDLNKLRTLWQSEDRQAALQFFDEQAHAFIAAFMTTAKPYLLDLFMRLDEENLQHYQRYSEGKQDDWFEHLESDAAKRENRAEKLDDWFGRISDSQSALLDEHIALLPDEYAIRLRNNAQWQERFELAVLARDRESLSSWLSDFSIWWTDDYRQLRLDNRQQWQALLHDLLPTLSEREREHADERVQDWIETLEDVL